MRLKNQGVGTVQVIKMGLYYRFVCKCRGSREEIYRLMLRCGGECLSLGILVPEGAFLRLDKKLPSKQLPEGEPDFTIVSKDAELKGSGFFVPLSPSEPFAYLTQLKDAFLTVQNGKTGVWIPGIDPIQSMASSSPTGQWSEPITSE